MSTNNSESTWNKYGLTITTKVPADFKRKMEKDAKQLGVSLAAHAATVLMSTDQKDEAYRLKLTTRIAEAKLAEQEKFASLEKSHKLLLKESMTVSVFERELFNKIKRNRDILLQSMQIGTPVTKAMLTKSGFDFGLCTGMVRIGPTVYFTMVDVAYNSIEEKVNIIHINGIEVVKPLTAKS